MAGFSAEYSALNRAYESYLGHGYGDLGDGNSTEGIELQAIPDSRYERDHVFGRESRNEYVGGLADTL
jgi:hypothetical protein